MFLTNPQCYHYAYRQRNKFSKDLAKASSPKHRLRDLSDKNALEGRKEKKCRSPKQKPRIPALTYPPPLCQRQTNLGFFIKDISHHKRTKMIVSSPLFCCTHMRYSYSDAPSMHITLIQNHRD